MRDTVSVVGVSQTKFEDDKGYQTIPEMIFEVTTDVLADADIPIADIDAVVTSSVDLWDGGTATNALIADAVGSVMKPETRIASDGLGALMQGVMMILADAADLVLVVSHGKGSMAPQLSISNWTFDPVYQQTLGLDYLIAGALQARAYMERYGVSEEGCALAAVKALKNAVKNPFAQRSGEITVDDVMGSPPLAYPIKQMDAAPPSDGAAALILASEKRVRDLKAPAVKILGIGSSYDQHYLAHRDLSDGKALSRAAQTAYEMAGIENPVTEIDFMEITTLYSYEELMVTELLGLAQRGGGERLIQDGFTAMEGSLPVNPSGGMLSGNPINVSGLVRMIEVTLQLLGKAGKRQVKKAEKGLAHGMSGPCGEQQYVVIAGI
jgi:acetyl-CoA C-acetyltransferase